MSPNGRDCGCLSALVITASTTATSRIADISWHKKPCQSGAVYLGRDCGYAILRLLNPIPARPRAKSTAPRNTI
jgi:hypothetical protein